MMRGVIGVYFGVVLTPWKLVGFLGPDGKDGGLQDHDFSHFRRIRM